MESEIELRDHDQQISFLRNMLDQITHKVNASFPIERYTLAVPGRIDQ